MSSTQSALAGSPEYRSQSRHQFIISYGSEALIALSSRLRLAAANSEYPVRPCQLGSPGLCRRTHRHYLHTTHTDMYHRALTKSVSLFIPPLYIDLFRRAKCAQSILRQQGEAACSETQPSSEGLARITRATELTLDQTRETLQERHRQLSAFTTTTYRKRSSSSNLESLYCKLSAACACVCVPYLRSAAAKQPACTDCSVHVLARPQVVSYQLLSTPLCIIIIIIIVLLASNNDIPLRTSRTGTVLFSCLPVCLAIVGCRPVQMCE